MTGEVVKYKNELNSISFGALTETESNLAFAVFCKFKEKNKRTISFHVNDFKELINYERKDLKYDEFVFKACSKLQDLKFYGPDPLEKKKLISYIIFPRMSLSEDGEVDITIDEEIADYLNAITDNFTRFELAEFVNIRGTYAKTLYRLLKQYRATGWAQFEWQQFKQLMGIPNTYQMCDIDKQILKASIKELTKPQDLFDNVRQPFVNLKYEKIKGTGRGRGGKVVGIKFTFKKWDEQEQLNAPKEPTAQTGNFVPLNPNIVNKKPSIKAQGSK